MCWAPRFNFTHAVVLLEVCGVWVLNVLLMTVKAAILHVSHDRIICVCVSSYWTCSRLDTVLVDEDLVDLGSSGGFKLLSGLPCCQTLPQITTTLTPSLPLPSRALESHQEQYWRSKLHTRAIPFDWEAAQYLLIGNARTHKPSFGFPQKANDVGQSYPTSLCNADPTGKGKGDEENTEF